MKIKEIAELCGVDDTTILRWTRNISDCKMQSDIKSKLKKSGHGIASDFSLEETLAIIGDGGGNKTLAALLEENSKNKNALSIAGSGGGAVQILNKFNDRLERIEKAITDIKKRQLQISAQPEITDPKTAMLYFGGKFLEITGKDGNYVEVQTLFKIFKGMFKVEIDSHKFMYELPLAFPEIRLDTRRKYKALFRGCMIK
ncbi:hypothetical protein E4N90_03710 [Treponema denticola]|uniref:hypothetical protein n=1 Tax=Treponema denticola TaxID=158 RepID=UPI0020A47114|nr:hypothetical protein [Treponema denticola]UTD07098.1 hypothetical protein E4N90_03710 [Treponema denticola]